MKLSVYFSRLWGFSQFVIRIAVVLNLLFFSFSSVRFIFSLCSVWFCVFVLLLCCICLIVLLLCLTLVLLSLLF